MIQQRTGIAVFAMIALLLISGASATAKQRMKEGGMALPLPKIIAHRGGPDNWPPNTLCAMRHDLDAGTDAIELDVQVTSDGVAVVYHPEDLSEQTTSSGRIANRTAAEVTALNASSKYKGPSDYQTACTPDELKVPRLADMLRRFPNATFFVDLKSLPAAPLVKAIARDVPKTDLKRLVFYSTNAEHIAALKKAIPQAVHFEDRATTFNRLIDVAATHTCSLPGKSFYAGFELFRNLEVCEKFKLGGNCRKSAFEMWSPESMACTARMTESARIVFFGIDTPALYEKARQLGAFAVYSNNPMALLDYRKKLPEND